MADISRLPGPVADVWEWQYEGACRDADPSVFFHPEGERGPSREARDRAAKAVCATCPVIARVRGARPRGARALRRLGRPDRGRARGASTARQAPSSSSADPSSRLEPGTLGPTRSGTSARRA